MQDKERFWVFVATASALQASHQVYYGFGTLYWRSLGFSDATIGFLWAEGVLAEIVLFWQGRRLLARFGPVGLLMLGGAAGILRWSLAGLVSWLPAVVALQVLHAFTFGASHLGAMQFLSRTVPLFGRRLRAEPLRSDFCGIGQRSRHGDRRRCLRGIWRSAPTF